MPSYEMDSLTFADSSKLVDRQQQETENFYYLPTLMYQTQTQNSLLNTWVLSLCVH